MDAEVAAAPPHAKGCRVLAMVLGVLESVMLACVGVLARAMGKLENALVFFLVVVGTKSLVLR